MGFFLRDAIESECLDIFPRALPDEALESVMTRFSVINSINSRSILYRKLFGRACITGRFFTEDLLALSKRVVGTNGSDFYINFLRNHTYHSLIENFWGVNENDTILRHAELISDPTRSLKICPACMKEDIESIGVPYWRRSHQIGEVFCCWKHSIYLYKIKFTEKDFYEEKQFFMGGHKYIYEHAGSFRVAEEKEVQFAKFLKAVVGLKVLDKDMLSLCFEGRNFENNDHGRESWVWGVKRTGYSLRSAFEVFGSAEILESFANVH